MTRYFFASTDWGIYDSSNYSDFDSTDNNYVLQGYSSRNHDGDNLRSALFFNSTTIRNSLANQRITACALNFDVEAFGTSGDIANMVFGTHNYTSWSNYLDPNRVKRDRLRLLNVGRGTYTEFALGTTIGTEFRDGVSTGIALGPAPNYQEVWRSGIIKPGYSTGPVLVVDAVAFNQAPYAPALSAPADSAVLDTYNLTTQFSWAPSDPDGDPQAAWIFRRTKPDGSFDYWNGTAFQSTSVQLTQSTAPLTNNTMSIPPNVWANGAKYGWSVASVDPSGLVGNFSAVRTLYTSTPPSANNTGPSSPVNVARPTISWTFTDPNGDAQYGWAAQIVEQSVYSAPNYNPDNYLGQAWSGSGQGTATSTQPTVDLVNHKTYRAYVRVFSSPNPSGGVQFSPWTYITFTVIIPPYAPGISYPQNGSNVDLAAGFTLTWANVFFNNVGSQTGFAIRRNIAGGAYQWWSGSAWGSIETFLGGTAPSYAFRTNEVANAQTYTFSVAIRDDFSQVSPYATGSTCTGTTTAQVTVSSPLGAANVNNPIVTWSVFQRENNPQQTWQVRIIDATVYTAATGTFDPGAATAVWDSNENADTFARTATVTTNLINSHTYRAYVRVKTLGVYSGWSYAEFNVAIVPPATPAGYTIVQTDEGAIDIYIQGRDSMLTENTSRSASGWLPLANCNVTNSVYYASSQSQLMSTMTCSATGTMSARNTNYRPASPGQTYTAAATLVAGAGSTPVNGYVSIEFYDVANTLISIVSGNVVNDASAVRSSITTVAPDNTASAMVRITAQSVAATGQNHNFFDPVLRPGTGTEWSTGGMLGSTFVSIVESNDNRPIRHSQNIPVPVDTQQVVVRDEEVPMGKTQNYSISTKVVRSPTVALTSNPDVLPDAVWTSGWLWISDPLRPGSGYAFKPQSFTAVTRPATQGKFRAIGRPDAIITTGVRGLREGGYTIVAHSRLDRDTHTDLTINSDIMLIRVPPDTVDPFFSDPEGETIYVRPEGDLPETRPIPIRTPHRTITQGWTEQNRPTDQLNYSGS